MHVSKWFATLPFNFCQTSSIVSKCSSAYKWTKLVQQFFPHWSTTTNLTSKLNFSKKMKEITNKKTTNKY